MAKILLVEDDNNLREIYEARLQAEGYQIVSANDGEAALVVAKAEKPDLIISDVMMPKISGFEMLDILRNTEELKATKVIMLTALGQADDQSRADKLGADRYLVKSQVTLEDIVRVSHELLGDQPAAAAASPPASGSSVPPATDPVATTPVAVTPPPASVNTPSAAPVSISVAAPPEEPTTNTPAPVSDTPTPTADPAAPPATNRPVTPSGPSAPVEVSAPVTTAPPIDNAVTSSAGTAQSSADEEAAVTKQIEDFVAAPPVAAPTVVPSQEDSNTDPFPVTAAAPNSDAVNDDKVLADAVNNLVASADTPEKAVSVEASPVSPVATETLPAPEPSSGPTPESVTTGAVPVAHKKVIQPIAGEPKPDLDALLAAEEAKEQPSTNIVVSDDSSSVTADQPPSTATPAPGSSIEPSSGGVDPNSIAL